MKRIIGTLAALFIIALLLLLPLIGVWLKGEPVTQYMEFPPLTHYVEHAEFSWIGFVIVAVSALALFIPLGLFLVRSWKKRTLPVGHFPAWGWLGIVWIAAAWILAWTRFNWTQALQPFMFSPLWFGYIVIVNALTFRQRGSCMMTVRPRYFLLLFPVSAAFWWYFEYLNRFVQNWYYIGITDITPVQYFWMATLPFSTVLPAVLGTHELLDSLFVRSAEHKPSPKKIKYPQWIPLSLLAISAVGLAFLAVLPDILFPLLWLSPLLVISAIRMLAGHAPLDVEPGNTLPRRIALLATAALICGFFWELWNYHSMAQWIYAVPYVNRFLIFEMPILGYTGYLPFGVECALVGDAVQRWCNRTKRNGA